MFACDAVDLDFLDTAPRRLDATVKVDRPPSEVFAALAHDPANWGEFFPGFDRTGAYHSSAPHGVGSRSTKRVTGIKIDESVLAWDEGARLAFRVDATTPRLFTPGLRTTAASLTAMAALCCESPSAASRDLPSNWQPVCCSQYSHALMTRVGHNLEHGRWFSTPTTNP
jgi:hypothetical protein